MKEFKIMIKDLFYNYKNTKIDKDYRYIVTNGRYIATARKYGQFYVNNKQCYSVIQIIMFFHEFKKYKKRMGVK